MNIDTPSDGEEYLVEGIAGIKYDFATGNISYLIKWKNYDETTWEPENRLEDLCFLTPEWTKLAKQMSEKFQPYDSIADSVKMVKNDTKNEKRKDENNTINNNTNKKKKTSY